MVHENTLVELFKYFKNVNPDNQFIKLLRLNLIMSPEIALIKICDYINRHAEDLDFSFVESWETLVSDLFVDDNSNYDVAFTPLYSEICKFMFKNSGIMQLRISGLHDLGRLIQKSSKHQVEELTTLWSKFGAKYLNVKH